MLCVFLEPRSRGARLRLNFYPGLSLWPLGMAHNRKWLHLKWRSKGKWDLIEPSCFYFSTFRAWLHTHIHNCYGCTPPDRTFEVSLLKLIKTLLNPISSHQNYMFRSCFISMTGSLQALKYLRNNISTLPPFSMHGYNNMQAITPPFPRSPLLPASSPTVSAH